MGNVIDRFKEILIVVVRSVTQRVLKADFFFVTAHVLLKQVLQSEIHTSLVVTLKYEIDNDLA